MTRRAFLVWWVFVPIAILNGAIRDLWIAPETGAAAAHVISTVTLCLAILAWTSMTIWWVRPVDARAVARIGAIWLVLTLAFEFLAGHYVFRTPWSQLLADYDLIRGRVWIAVPITTALAPWLAVRLRHVLGDVRVPARSGGHMRPRAGGVS
jgi:hypothetical protein